MHSIFFLLPWLLLGPAALAAKPAGGPAPACRLYYEQLLGPTAEEKSVLEAAAGSFAKLPALPPAETAARNRAVLRELDALSFPERRAGSRRVAADASAREKLFADVMALPEVEQSLCGSYRGSGKFGYCFGRALVVHLKALQSGIDKRTIRKIWMVGKLRTGESRWNFHVATIIRGEDGVWYAFDPSFGRIVTAAEWHDTIRAQWDPGKTSRLFSTAAAQFYYDSHRAYTTAQLKREIFRGFFSDVMEKIRSGR